METKVNRGQSGERRLCQYAPSLADQSWFASVLLVISISAMGCSSGGSDANPPPATGTEPPNTTTPEERGASPRAPATRTPEREEIEQAQQAPDNAAPREDSEADSAERVCSTFSFDLRGMPHRGPRDVDQGMIESRVSGLMYSVREAAGEPRVDVVRFGGGSSFVAAFSGSSGMQQCERTRAEVAPPIPDNVTGRRRFSYDESTECGECAPEVIEALNQLVGTP